MNTINKINEGKDKELIISERYVAIDIFRIVCSLLVVAIHCSIFIEQYSELYFIINNIISRIAVPFFFMTTGYFFYKKYSKNSNILKITILKLLQIYILWSIIYLAIELYSKAKTNSINIGYLIGMIKRIIFSGSNAILWYIPASIISLIFISFFIKKNRFKSLFIVGLALYIFGMLGNSYNGIVHNTKFQQLINIYNIIFTNSKNGLCMGVIFISLGIFINKYNINKKLQRNNLLLVISILIMITEIAILNKYLNITSFDMYISLLFVVPLIFIILTKIKVNIKINSELFRNISLYIYVSHGVFLIITRAILEYLNLNAIKGISSIKFLIVSSTSIIFSILIIKAKQALIKIKNIYMVG